MPTLTKNMQKEIMGKVEEENPKRRKLSDSIHDEDQFVFLTKDIQFGTDVCTVCFVTELEDIRTKPVVDPDIRKMISSIQENRKKYPLPKHFQNWGVGDGSGSRMLRFDDIGEDVLEFLHFSDRFIPPGMTNLVSGTEVYSLGSKYVGFVQFNCHEFAKRFLNEFNGLEITGTNYSFKLSWAPFVRNFDCEHATYHEHPTNVTDAELDKKKLEECLKVDEAFESFYISLDKKVHEKEQDPWVWLKPEWPKYLPDYDDGTTTTLYFDMVDPIITEDQMKCVFNKYGDCSIKLPSGNGSGFVTFVKRSDAENAFSCLEYVFRTFSICFLHWGIEEDEEPDDWYIKDVPPPTRCHVLGNRCVRN